MKAVFYLYKILIRGSKSMENLEKVDLYQKTINEMRPFEGEMLKQIKELESQKDFLRMLHIPL